MTYVWYAIVVVGYIILSIILLLLNRKWKWIYGNRFIENLPLNSGHKIDVANIYHDPGLMMVLSLFGPALATLSLIFAVGLFVIALFMAMIITVPRHLINR